MNTQNTKSILAVAILSALSLSACNLDVNVNGETMATLTTTKTGVIVDLNKGITVNGVTYDTSEATVINNGLESDPSSLKNGMLVSVSGIENSDGTGKAVTIFYEDEVKGVVLTNNVTADNTGTLNVMGQTVQVDKDTVFQSFDVADLKISDIDKDNVVEVSGYASGDGEIWATRIEVKDSQYNDGDQVELKGNISGLTQTSFMIGNQVINTENAALDNDFMGSFQAGQYVEVKSDFGFDADGVLLASEIDLKGEGSKEVSHTENDDQIEIKGVITSAFISNELEVNGSTILIGQNTQASNVNMSQLDKGVIVEVEGYIDSNGNLVATKLEVESSFDESANNDDTESTGDNDDTSGLGSSGSNEDDSRNEVNELENSDNDND